MCSSSGAVVIERPGESLRLGIAWPALTDSSVVDVRDIVPRVAQADHT
jgi:hypothetical protein